MSLTEIACWVAGYTWTIFLFGMVVGCRFKRNHHMEDDDGS
jgi:hypothetical protein